MNENSAQRLAGINSRIEKAAHRFGPLSEKVRLVAVSKTFPPEKIVPVLAAGQRMFGENRVQEAMAKWPGLKSRFADVELHLIGPLQTNKVREAVALFDVIETLDREKLAKVLAREMSRAGKNLPLFVQVNIGQEAQKSGIAADQTVDFVERCQQVHGLNVVGLMCIPPLGEAPGPYFAQTRLLAEKAGLEHLSMGMSADFETAIAMGADHVRVGSALFGARGV